MTVKKNDIDPRSLCRCCGWDTNDFPWGEDGMSSSFIICDCCGCEAGYEDYCTDSLLEYRKEWLDSGAKWHYAKTEPFDWESGRQRQEQLDRLKPKRFFHKVPEFSPFGSGGYKTPEEAIAAGKSIDAKRKEELQLDLDLIRGKTVKRIHWSTTELSLEFERDLYLVLQSGPEKINVFISTENIANRDQWYEFYEFEYNDELSSEWHPIYPARYFTGRVFTGIQLQYHFTWLYFQKCPKLIEVVQFAAKESELPVLTWEAGV